MKTYIEQCERQAKQCSCGNKHYSIPIEELVVEHGALEQAALYIARASEQAVLIADQHTWKAAGDELSQYLDRLQSFYTVSLIQPDQNGDVLADEASLVQAILDIPQEAELIVAVGSGTIHDIARFCSYKLRKPFISVPTAPSVDGFTSMGAPLVIKKVKQTFQTIAPIAVFADLAVLREAPQSMIAAGFGDMLGKYTSLADWEFGHLTAKEPYCPVAAAITREALAECVSHIASISRAEEQGIRALTEALMKSGLAMLIMGYSYPASGGEHHLSHYWEMAFLREERPQQLHGAKVGAATALIVKRYQEEVPAAAAAHLSAEQSCKVAAIVNGLPSPEELQRMMSQAGGAARPEDLGINAALVEASLKEAHLVRDRSTMLRFLNAELQHR